MSLSRDQINIINDLIHEELKVIDALIIEGTESEEDRQMARDLDTILSELG